MSVDKKQPTLEQLLSVWAKGNTTKQLIWKKDLENVEINVMEDLVAKSKNTNISRLGPKPPNDGHMVELRKWIDGKDQHVQQQPETIPEQKRCGDEQPPTMKLENCVG